MEKVFVGNRNWGWLIGDMSGREERGDGGS